MNKAALYIRNEYRYNPPAADGRKVIIADSDHLWGHGVEVQWIWKSVTRGMNPIFMDPWEPIPTNKISVFGMDGSVDKNQRYFHNYDAARRNMGYARKMVERMDLNKCVPHDELFTSTYCLANPGDEYLCFLSCGESGGIDFWDMTDEFTVEWLDPATGKTYKGQKVLKIMAEKETGYIININSTAAFGVPGFHAAYGASKCGLTGLSQAMYDTAKKYKIKVSSIYPGYTDTKMLRDLNPDVDPNLWLLPEDITYCIMFLLKASERLLLQDIIPRAFLVETK